MNTPHHTRMNAGGASLRLKEAMEMTGLKKTSIYQKIKEGDFPLGFYVSMHARRWPEEEVVAWVEAQKLAPTAERAVLGEKNAARLNAARLGRAGAAVSEGDGQGQQGAKQ